MQHTRAGTALFRGPPAPSTPVLQIPVDHQELEVFIRQAEQEGLTKKETRFVVRKGKGPAVPRLFCISDQ